MARSKIIGIDLGTTNSCVAVVERGVPIIIPNGLGQCITPSVVRILQNGEVVIGDHANRSRLVDPQNTITGIKRFIGRRFNEVIDIAETMPFEVNVGQNNIAVIKAWGVEYSPQRISAMILGALKASAEAYLGESVTDAVITIPAYFNHRQRQATKEAGEIAGLRVLRIINEPTAAALAYGLTRNPEEYIAVFDLGGGTFDISILQLGDGVYEVKAIDGDGFLGGDNFDEIIVEWITEEFKLQHGIDVSEDRQAMQRIREEAVQAKCTLSQFPDVVLNIPFLTIKNSLAVNLRMILTRSRFEQMCGELFKRIVKPCERALRNAGLTGGEIDRVILVGGATRMPKITEIVNSIFRREPSRSVNPEEAVALGAAIQAAIFAGEVKDVLLLDVVSASLGVEIENGRYIKLIEKNTTFPTKKSWVFSTSLHNQSSVEIHILEGEKALVINNRSLGRFVLDDIPLAPRATPQIEITFDVDANGILRVEAKDLSTGKAKNLIVKASTGLMDSELQTRVSSTGLT